MNDLKEIGGFIVSADPFVQHDNTLSGNGTSASPLGVVNGYNETVLFDVSTGSTAVTLSELATNFERIKITYNSNEATTAVPEIREFPSTATTLNLFQRFVKSSNDFVIDDVQKYNTNDFINYTTTTAAGSHAWYSMPFTYAGASQGSVISITKIVGINRK